MPLNAACAGRTYSPDAVRVRAETIQAFIHTLEEDNPYLVDPQRQGGIVAPPLYAAVLALPAVCEALADPDLGVPTGELLSLGCDFRLARPIRATREISVTASFGDIVETEKGEETTIRLRGTRKRGVLVFVGEYRLLHPRKPGTPEPPQPASNFLRPPLAFRAQYKVIANLRRLIHEPPGHVHGEAAQAFLGHSLGLAYAAKAAIDASQERDPSQLRRIYARPVRALTPGETIVTAGWIMETRRGVTFFGFEILAEDGRLVMADGCAEVMLK